MINSPIPRVAAVNDLSGFGKVSLTEAVPIISAMGAEVCPLPTAVLSTHTYKFTDYTFLDMTREMRGITEHWKRLGLHFDAVYSGYMGSEEQLGIVSDYIKFLKNASEKPPLIVIDPVLGDNVLADAETVYYDRMNGLLSSMRRYVRLADVITPNLTEACLLLGERYPRGAVSEEELKRILCGLAELGPRGVAVTSVMTDSDTMVIGVYDAESGKCELTDCGYVDRPFHGTGDIFASVLTGALVMGGEIFESARLAVAFIKSAIGETLKHPEIPVEHGVLFEGILADFFSKNRINRR